MAKQSFGVHSLSLTNALQVIPLVPDAFLLRTEAPAAAQSRPQWRKSLAKNLFLLTLNKKFFYYY